MPGQWDWHAKAEGAILEVVASSMRAEASPGGVLGLHRVLGTFDLVLLYVAAVIGLQSLSLTAPLGLASLSLWAIAYFAFFVPSALTVQELSSRIPHEGGLYLWTKAAFGETHGFLAGWATWVSNLVFFPSVLLYASGALLHVGGRPWLVLAESPVYNGALSLAILWVVTLLNILGLERAKWLQNAGGIATIAVAAQVLCGGVVAWWMFGPATHISISGFVPDLTSSATLNTFSLVVAAYTGLELAPLMGDEIKDTARSIRRAILISGVVIAIAYITGTGALLVSLPASNIGAVSGTPAAMDMIGQRLAVPVFGAIGAALLTMALTGGLGAWIGGTARLPFVMGLTLYLPERLGAIHPRYGSPYVALLVQSGATSVVLLAAISGSSVHDAFLLLVDMTAALVCVVWVYIFGSLAVLRRRAAGRNDGVSLIPGGTIACVALAGLGVATTAFATIASLIPPTGSAHPALFLTKGIGGCVLVFGVGIVLCRQGKNRLSAVQAASRAAGIAPPRVTS